MELDFPVKTWVCKETGETVTAQSVLHRVDRKDFEIVYISYLLDLFDKLGGQRYKVFRYIVANKSNDNTLLITVAELAKACGVSLQTTHRALVMLREAGIIKTRTGAIILNAKVLCRGSAAKEAYIMQKFEAFDKSPEPQQATLPLSQ